MKNYWFNRTFDAGRRLGAADVVSSEPDRRNASFDASAAPSFLTQQKRWREEDLRYHRRQIAALIQDLDGHLEAAKDELEDARLHDLGSGVVDALKNAIWRLKQVEAELERAYKLVKAQTEGTP